MLFRTAILVGLCSLNFSALAQEVYFSRAAGTFVDPFVLSLSASSSNAVIRYLVVTNAAQASAAQTNVPTTDSPIYSGPIPISVTTQVRARAFEPGGSPGPPVSESFIQISPDLAGFSSDLPFVIVHNFSQGTIANVSIERLAVVATFEAGCGRSSLANEADLVARAGIAEGDSEEEAGQIKQGVLVRFRNEFNQTTARPFLCLPEDSDWLLWSINGFDPGLMHNAIFHWIGRQVGRYSSRTRYVEVFLKLNAGPVTTNDYYGLYLAEEIPKRSPHRVEIATLGPEDTNAPAVSGGYLLRIDRTLATDRVFTVPLLQGSLGNYTNAYGNQSIILDDPTGLELYNDPRRTNQLRFIRNYFGNFITNLTGPNFANPVTGYAAYIDVDSWIDNHLVNTICFNVDSFRLHAYLFKDREKKIEQGPPWDCDRCLGTGGSGNTPQGDNRGFNPRQWRIPTTSLVADNGTDFFGRSEVGVDWWDRVFRDPDFWQRWIDRYQALRANQLANGAVLATVDNFHNEIKEAQAREQARWASSFSFPRWGVQSVNGYTFDFGPRDTTLARGGYFTNEVNFQKKWLLDRLDFMDTNFLAMPVVTVGAGQVTPGTTVTVQPAARPNTVLLYTLDGTDPRLPGGNISPGARTNLGNMTLTITSNVWLFARCYNTNHFNLTNVYTSPAVFEVGKPPSNSFWSGPISAPYYTAVPPLRITEVMYHATPSDAFDFIELRNTGATPLNVARFRIRGDVRFDFPELVLDSGEHCVVVPSILNFQLRYGSGTLIAGVYSGSLPDDDGHLVLEGSAGEPILDFTYQSEWHLITDGFGFSLVATDEDAPSSNWSQAAQWRPSGVVNGTPGATDPGLLVLPAIYVNEALAYIEPPSGNAVELYNSTPSPVNLGGWFLTDSLSTPKKYRIPDGTLIAADGYLVLYEADSFGTGPNAFEWDGDSDAVYLFSADALGNLTGWVHGFAFGAQAAGATVGRFVSSAGTDQFATQLTPSLGAVNSGPRVGPVVVSEINSHPPNLQVRCQGADNSIDEFIELQNISSSPVSLGDAANPASAWQLRGTVAFMFPPTAVIPAGGFALVVSFNPANASALNAFRSVNNVAPDTPIFGPWNGRLDNSQGIVELVQPDPTLPGSVRYFVIDQVAYQSTPPWPLGANGTGASITRIDPAAYGNDPSNWLAAARTPGAPNPGGPPPVIVLDPVDSIGIETLSASLTIAATGPAPLGYQWLFNGTAIYGAVNPELMLTNLQLSQAGSYTCVVFGPGGSALSRSAHLTVRMIARILGHPQPVTLRGSASDIDYGNTTNNATFNVSAASTTPLHFQWRVNGEPIPGATSTTLVVSNVNLSHDGLYDVAITDDVTTVFSNPAHLTVLVNPAILIPPPSHVQVVTGATFSVSATARGNPLPFGFEWRQLSMSRASNTVYATSDFMTFMAPASLVTSQSWRVVVRNVANSNANANSQFFVTTLIDRDADGIPDVWEIANGFNPTNNADRDLDGDGDGLGNWAEYIAGTDPADALSTLKIDLPLPGTVLIQFLAASNRTYAIEAHDTAGSGSWNRVAGVVAMPTNRVVVVPDSQPRAPQRFYRVVTPPTD